MKSVARQRRQPCVLGRYPQPVFLYISASSSGTGRSKRAVGAQAVGETARGFQRRRGSISEIEYAHVGQRRSCMVAVGRSRQDRADLTLGVDNLFY
jgi:hypothetical protein